VSAAPVRRFRLLLDLQADSEDALISALHVLANDADVDGLVNDRTSGGTDSGYHLTVVDGGEAITPESYAAERDAWLAARRKNP
jgi:hypothetical protein